MSGFVRLLIAVFVFLGQSGLAQATSVCPDDAVSKDVCPMSQLEGCTCCGDASKPKPDKHSCTLTDAGSDDQAVPSAFPQIPTPHALVSAPLQVQTMRLIRPAFQRIHLVVPRIRTPDPGTLRLRAPPAS